jgi:hypothetical protein
MHRRFEVTTALNIAGVGAELMDLRQYGANDIQPIAVICP